MAYKQKSGSPFQRNFGIGKSPLEGQSKSSTPAGKDHDKKHSEGHWEKEENKGTHPKHEKGNKAERLKEAMAKIKASKAETPLEMASPMKIMPSYRTTYDPDTDEETTEQITDAQAKHELDTRGDFYIDERRGKQYTVEQTGNSAIQTLKDAIAKKGGMNYATPTELLMLETAKQEKIDDPEGEEKQRLLNKSMRQDNSDTWRK